MSLGMLGKYERLDILGHGASGIVYLAQDSLLKKRVALKEINAQGDEQQRVLEEARVLDRLRHPNIVAVNSVDTINGKVVIDMEYVQGSNLLEIIRESDGPLPLDYCVDIIAQVCDGLAYAHRQRTVHRDIKPANILVSDQRVVKLADFGLAQVLGTNSYAGGAGTFAYMAPEDFEEGDRSDRQSDIWSVGVVLYEMLTSKRPFSVANPRDPFAWSRAISTENVKPPSFFQPDIPDELDQVCLRALNRTKSGRYADAAVMAEDLRAALSEEKPHRATPPVSPSSDSPDVQSKPLNPLLTSWTDIDGFLKNAPEHWDEAAELLADGSLTLWLNQIHEPLLGRVASEIQERVEDAPGASLREFMYSAGFELEECARAAYLAGSDAMTSGNYPLSVELLQRAVNLDPSHSSYPLQLANASRLAGDIDLMRESLVNGLSRHPKDRAMKRLLADIGGAPPELNVSGIDFGSVHHGELRASQVIVRSVDSKPIKGRVATTPGWLSVTPVTFEGKSRQVLKLEADSGALHPEAMEYAEHVVIETSGGTIELPVSLTVAPLRPNFAQIMPWYVSILLFCLLPSLSGALATFVSHRHNQDIAVLPGGLIASGFLFAGFLVINLVVDANLLERLAAALGIVLLPLGFYQLGLHALQSPASLHGAWAVTIGATLLSGAVPSLQAGAYFRLREMYVRWPMWCAVIAVVSIIVAALLWNSGGR
jgi:serine/threonine protein kinase